MPQTMFPGIRLFLLLALEGSSVEELVEKPESSTNAVPAVTKKNTFMIKCEQSFDHEIEINETQIGLGFSVLLSSVYLVCE